MYHSRAAKVSANQALAPVPVTGFACDGNTYKCTAALDFGDGNWKADWSVNVYHSA